MCVYIYMHIYIYIYIYIVLTVGRYEIFQINTDLPISPRVDEFKTGFKELILNSCCGSDIIFAV